ncbi:MULTISPECIES: spore coat protein [Bacillaceae]|uniref:spore coat protein n=1 Tax=Bacillaceae TaxID=186817 RepID=UPI0006CF588E|nr:MULTISPECIES: spore coat protein [Bacillaceae]
MNNMVQSMAGMGAMTDQVIATDLLISAKSGVRNCAIALTEAATPEVRNVLQQQLTQAVQFHGQVSQYMMEKGYYHPYHPQEQYKIDFAASQAALNTSQDQLQ